MKQILIILIALTFGSCSSSNTPSGTIVKKQIIKENMCWYRSSNSYYMHIESSGYDEYFFSDNGVEFVASCENFQVGDTITLTKK